MGHLRCLCSLAVMVVGSCFSGNDAGSCRVIAQWAEARLGNVDGRQHRCVCREHFAAEVRARLGYEPASLLFAQKKLSNVLDTRTLEEQYEFEVSLFRWTSRYSVHTQFLKRASSASSANRAEPIRFSLFLARSPTSCSTYRFTPPDASGFRLHRASPAR